MERLPLDCVGHILHPRILQHRVCVAWRDLLPHSAADGNIRRRQRLLQQLLRPWSTLPPDWQHPEVVAQESGSTIGFVEVVPKRISRVLHVLFHSNDYSHRECGKRRELAARNHTPALDFRCALALGLPHCSRAMGGAIRFRSLRHHAHLAYRGRYPHGSLPSSHMVRVLPNGQYDSNDLQT